MVRFVPHRPEQFPHAPLKARHVFAVCRFDGFSERSDPTESFTLTRGYWTEHEAQEQAARLNAEVAGREPCYFVLPVRVSDSAP
jgi:hypothetical protein